MYCPGQNLGRMDLGSTPALPQSLQHYNALFFLSDLGSCLETLSWAPLGTLKTEKNEQIKVNCVIENHIKARYKVHHPPPSSLVMSHLLLPFPEPPNYLHCNTTALTDLGFTGRRVCFASWWHWQKPPLLMMLKDYIHYSFRPWNFHPAGRIRNFPWCSWEISPWSLQNSRFQVKKNILSTQAYRNPTGRNTNRGSAVFVLLSCCSRMKLRFSISQLLFKTSGGFEVKDRSGLGGSKKGSLETMRVTL